MSILGRRSRRILGMTFAAVLLLTGERAAMAESARADSEFFSRGINLSSGALHSHGSIYGTDYVYPPPEDFAYYERKGFSVVRLPYRWERLQHSLFGALDGAELNRIRSVVAVSRAHNMRIILSPHNFGRFLIDGREHVIGTDAVPIAAFADFSYKVAAAFAGDNALYGLSLMNEPHDSQGLWKQTAQAGLDAIRRADGRRLVLAPGDQWSGAWSWQRANDDFLLNDAADRIMYEAHQYFDFDHTGTYKVGYDLNGASPDRGVDWVRPFVDWIKRHRARGIITEFGVPNDDVRWHELARRLLVYLAHESIPWTYWAGGPWWGNYPLSAEPKDGVDAPIMATLAKHYAR